MEKWLMRKPKKARVDLDETIDLNQEKNQQSGDFEEKVTDGHEIHKEKLKSNNPLIHPKFKMDTIYAEKSRRELPSYPNQPSQGIPRQNVKGRERTFNYDWFRTYPWLHYDEATHSVMCFTCLKAIEMKLITFTKTREDSFLRVGFSNWKKGIEKFKVHQLSNIHKESVLKLSNLECMPVSSMLHAVEAEDQRIARIALEKIFTTLRLLAKQGIAIRSHSDKDSNFNDFIELRAEDCKELKTFIQRKKNFLSPQIQNEILQMMSHSVLRTVLKKIKDQEFSIILDETTDVSGEEQVSVCIRTVEDMTAQEYFLGLYVTPITTGEALTNVILDSLTRFGLSVRNIRGQCYDGAANMSGCNKGVQARILELQPLAIYVHCGNHRLNLAVQDAISAVIVLRDTMQWLNDIGVIIKESPKRMSQFKDLCKEKDIECGNPRPLCPTRWCGRLIAIHNALESYPAIISSLEILSMSKDPIAAKASGLFEKAQNSICYFSLLVCKSIFGVVEKLSILLQKKDLTYSGAQDAVSKVVLRLKDLRSVKYFEEIWAETLSAETKFDLDSIKLPRKRGIPKKYSHTENPADHHNFRNAEDMCRKIYFEAFDNVIGDIQSRFDESKYKKLVLLEDILLNGKLDNDREEVLHLYDIDHKAFKIQHDMLRHINSDNVFNSLQEIVEFITKLSWETKELFPDVLHLIRLLLVIPATSATAERSFSMLRRIKSYLRSTMSQKRLNHICVLSAYRKETDNLDLNELMKEFISASSYRVTVFGAVA